MIRCLVAWHCVYLGFVWTNSARVQDLSVLYLLFHSVNFSQFVADQCSNLGNDHACPLPVFDLRSAAAVVVAGDFIDGRNE